MTETVKDWILSEAMQPEDYRGLCRALARLGYAGTWHKGWAMVLALQLH